MSDNRITAGCELYVCRECRTKTGWPHQRWCTLRGLTEPDCGECRYYGREKRICVHPAARKGRSSV
ncbi:MAG: hypothetical protein IJS72_03565 [Oscillospiraceae bacterium]|nr:hypothetical protein [Oscillospiraceae bacterium]